MFSPTRQSYGFFPLSYLLACFLLLSSFTLFVFSHQPRLDNSRGFLFDSHHSTLSVPISIGVSLVGLQGEGAAQTNINPSLLSQSLTAALSTFSPANQEEGKLSHIQYHTDYSVRHVARQTILTEVEQLISSKLILKGQTRNNELVYDIEAKELEHYFLSVYEEEFGRAEETTTASTSEVEAQLPYVVFFINPDKTRMTPPKWTKDKSWIYRYRYDGGAPTSHFIAIGRFVLIDLSAGPISYGAADQGEGTVTYGTLPVLVPSRQGQGEVIAATSRTIAHFTSVVVSCVRSVFLGDISSAHLKKFQAEKLFIPLVLFRNHRRFHSFHSTETEFFIDKEVVRYELEKLILPGQEYHLIEGTHSLHDHPVLSTAVFKALKTDTVHTATATGAYISHARPYLDSAILIEELENAADEVVSALLPEFSLPLATHRSVGHRILPVFIFSLLGFPPGLLLDQKTLHVATKRFVVVLQTGSTPTPIPYFTDSGGAVLNPRHVTRHIVAGLATSLGGISAPFLRLNVEGGVYATDYLWSVGCLPWGPFSNTNSLSIIFGDRAIRNTVLNRAIFSWNTIKKLIQRIDEHNQAFVHNMYGETLDEINPGDVTLSSLLQHGLKSSPWGMSSTVFTRISADLLEIEDTFRRVGLLVQKHQWKEANTLAGALVPTTRAFEQFVSEELENLQQELECCHKTFQSLDPDGALTWDDVFFSVLFFLWGSAILWLLYDLMPKSSDKFLYKQIGKSV